MSKTPEQQARDMLERLGHPRAQELSAGDVVELANLIAETTDKTRNMLQSLLDPATPAHTTALKAEQLINEGCTIVGFVMMRPNGDRRIIDHGKVVWFSRARFIQIMIDRESY